jgi:hypothetical protein
MWQQHMVVAALSFDSVIELGLKLPNVTESRYYGARALKVNGNMLACTPVHRSAETNCAVVAMDIERRTTLLRAHPSYYYTTDHYAPHPTVLIRLSAISRIELERTLRAAWEYVSSESAAPKRPRRRAVRKNS